MATYYTQGLPDGTHKETRYEFTITKHPKEDDRSEAVYYLAIPGNYDPHDQTGNPTYPGVKSTYKKGGGRDG